MMQLSILIPTFNDPSEDLVKAFRRQCEAVQDLDWEIVVGDDGSTDALCRQQNQAIAALPHCRVVESPHNIGRAAIRNRLCHEARGEWLLFVDADMALNDPHYLIKYIEASASADIVCGGYVVADGPRGNLRYRYERKAAPLQSAAHRRQQPWQNFKVSNALIRRSIMLAHPFDERISRYGYEDVLLGKQLQQAGCTIRHIDAPVVFHRYETNAAFLAKTEEGLRTLWQFRSELAGYSALLRLCRRRIIRLARPVIIRLFSMLQATLRRNLLSQRPSLALFNFYKLGFFLSLDAHRA